MIIEYFIRSTTSQNILNPNLAMDFVSVEHPLEICPENGSYSKFQQQLSHECNENFKISFPYVTSN
jgi:hypothetical protein